MNIKVIAGFSAAGLLVWWAIKDPATAPYLVTNIGSFLRGSAAGFSHFLSGI